MKNGWLVAAGLLSTAASLLHVATIIGSPDWYRFFGAGEELARAAERGSAMPGLVTAAIAAILAVWALYAFSAAGLVRRLPMLRTVLVLITGVYLLRGLALVPLLVFKPQLVDTFAIVSSVIVLCYGLTYAVGTWLAWPSLRSTITLHHV
ncbi:hypothetical protein [Polymorphobacter fuscus]|uniref:Uncharacterized protein n=1 Tax=Sandarakinorhabdus fusca TaxID=1439888 RepID=A0A7C9KW47_9SPHN|nr:hypothetical protein [Polymorphobacter fuscus]KAB7647451.1 hypothetical protein F9290_05460 [Polymorphobacter fuscus]MQT16705.1 hypothetical protein [Polymorphobacter fuscus]NJC09308.1 hypothetical protein [Polymorphobacter fuscus]